MGFPNPIKDEGFARALGILFWGMCLSLAVYVLGAVLILSHCLNLL